MKLLPLTDLHVQREILPLVESCTALLRVFFNHKRSQTYDYIREDFADHMHQLQEGNVAPCVKLSYDKYVPAHQAKYALSCK